MIEAGADLKAALRHAGDRPVLISESESVTAVELNDRIDLVAAGLADRDLTRQRIGVWAWNSFETIESHLAVERIGGTRIPIDPSAPPDEAAKILEAGEASAVLVDVAHAGSLPELEVVHGITSPLRGDSTSGTTEVHEDHLALLFPRMATGAEFLAVPLTYSNWVATMRINVGLYRDGTYGPAVRDDDVFLTVQQVAHGTGLVGTFPFLYLGLPQVVLERFDAGGVVDALATYGVTSTFLVPGMVTRVVDALDPETDLALRRLLYGGGPISRDDLVRCTDRLGAVLIQLYGRYEGGWPMTTLGQSEHQAILDGDLALASSCGRPIPGIEVEVQEIPDVRSHTGELKVRGPMAAPSFADPDGWCSLGDLARVDARGYIYLEGRLDGMISTGAFHVYPAEVEKAIAAIEGVRAVTVTGESHPDWGEIIVARIDWRQDPTTFDPEELKLHLSSQLARYKIPRRFELMDSA